MLTGFVRTSAAMVAVALASSPAHALLNRAFVSGKGVDSAACGTAASPCRTLQFVHDTIISAGGEVDILDPAGYGSLAITKPLSVVNDGVGTAGIQAAAAGNGVTITVAAGETVHLRGLTIEGAGASSNGIVFDGAGTLDVANCVIRHFTSDGILLRPNAASEFSITDTIVADNGGNGIEIGLLGTASVKGAIDRVSTMNNAVANMGFNGNGSGVSGTIAVTVSDSIATNGSNGIFVSAGGTAKVDVSLRGVVSAHNGNGISGGTSQSGTATVRLAHSVITGNSTGVNLPASLTVLSFGDNDIDGNTTNTSAALGVASNK